MIANGIANDRQYNFLAKKMENWLTTSQVAQLAQVNERIIQLAVRKGTWRGCALRVRTVEGGKGGRGGTSYEFLLSSLPEEVQAHYFAETGLVKEVKEVRQEEPAAKSVATQLQLIKHSRQRVKKNQAEQVLKKMNTLTPAKQARDVAKHQLLALFKNFCQELGFTSQNKALDEFCEMYNTGRLAVDSSVREFIPKLSRATYFNWQNKLRTIGHLGGEYEGHQDSSIDLQPELKAEILHLLSDFPTIRTQHLLQALQVRWTGEVPSYQVLHRWVNRWKAENQVLHVAMQNPDQSKSHHMPAFGDADADVGRLNQRWEMDATPADVMLTDGRHTITGMIDVYSRRVKLLVSKHPKGTVNGALLRKCLLDWGVCEELKTDHGKDYVGEYLTRVLNALDITHVLCPPFRGDKKPFIERFFKTLSHSFLIELSPNFIGHNVNERQALRARQSFAERLMKRNEVVEIPLSAEQLQSDLDQWVEAVYHQKIHSSLRKAPLDRVREWRAPVQRIQDERALDILLLPRERRAITKKGINYNGNVYIHECLGSLFIREVEIQADPCDYRKIYVYGQKTAQSPLEFLCVAVSTNAMEPEEQRDIATKARKNYVASVQKGKKSLKNPAQEILAAAVERQETSNVVEFPKPVQEYTSDGLQAAAAAATTKPTAPVATWEDESLNQARTVLMNPEPELEEYESDNERAVNLTLASRPLTEEEQIFLSGYRHRFPEIADQLDVLRARKYRKAN